MNNFEKENKITVLLTALEERYKSLHVIRERVQNIGIWSLGLMLAAGGYLLQGQFVMPILQKFISLIGVSVAFYVLRFKYLSDLNKGFKSQQKVAARIEKVLGLFTDKFFDDESTSIYPKEWEGAGSKIGEGQFFKTTYMLLLIGFLFLVIAIIFSSCF